MAALSTLYDVTGKGRVRVIYQWDISWSSIHCCTRLCTYSICSGGRSVIMSSAKSIINEAGAELKKNVAEHWWWIQIRWDLDFFARSWSIHFAWTLFRASRPDPARVRCAKGQCHEIVYPNFLRKKWAENA
jgi:hypothetical protein